MAGQKPLVFGVARGKYLPRNAGERGPWVCGENVNLIPVICDHEEGGTGSAVRTQAAVSTRAIGVH